MKLQARMFLVFSLLLPLLSLAQENARVKVMVDVSQAPNAQEFADIAAPLLAQWYPQINTILYGENHPLPYPDLQLHVEPELSVKGALAYASENAIHVSSVYIGHMPGNFQGMLIHELTHINQHYPEYDAQANWVVEGIADYIRHKYFEKDIQPFLQMNEDGRLCGYSKTEPYFYGLQRAGVSLNQAGYLKSYTVASTFLYWLEQNKDKTLIRKLNRSLADGSYSEQFFMNDTKLSLDSLWLEFLTFSKRSDCRSALRLQTNN